MQKTFLKLQNRTVMEFNVDEGYYHVFLDELLPFPLRGRIQSSQQDYHTAFKNQEALLSFFSGRTLNIDRMYAKDILNALHISQKTDYETKYKIIVLCKALSVVDDYWITNDPNEKWEAVNLRDNPLHEAIAQIALSGKNLTITGEIRTPELTGQGAYPKAWYREDGVLYLYKAGAGHKESEIEVSVSNILDCTNVPHVQYMEDRKEGKWVAKCRNIADTNKAVIDAEDFASYCIRTGKDFISCAKNIDENLFFQTIVVDYLIANRDRHGANWGFYMNNSNGKIIGMHPLYDHNNAFAPEFMRDKDGGHSLMLQGKTQKEAALYAIRHCDFRITKPISRSLFLTDEMYECFMTRACELGLYQRQSPSFLQKIKAKPFTPYMPVEIKENNEKEYYENIYKMEQPDNPTTAIPELTASNAQKKDTAVKTVCAKFAKQTEQEIEI